MHHVSATRTKRVRHMLLCLLLIAQSLLPLRPAPTVVLAADADVDHCTDWPAASFKLPGVAQDDDTTTYRVSILLVQANVARK